MHHRPVNTSYRFHKYLMYAVQYCTFAHNFTWSKMVNIFTGEVQAKFAKLKTSYQREAKKISSTPSGSCGGVRPKWEYLEACSFMSPPDEQSITEGSYTLPSGQQVSSVYGIISINIHYIDIHNLN